MSRTLRRVLGGAAGLLAGLLVLALGAYLIACHTGWGRERLRRIALAELAPVFAGRIRVAELSRLSLSGIGLREVRVFDPSGAEVLGLQELELDWSLRRLLSGELALQRLGLRAGRIDLADLSGRRGLLAAFSTTSVAPEPAAQQRPLRLRLAELSVDGLDLAAELAGFGTLEAQDLSLRASYRQADVIELELASLSAQLRRDGRALGAIDSALGHYLSSGGPSTLRLAARVADTRLQFEGAARLPGDPAFEAAPLQLSVQLERLDAATFTALGRAEWGALLRQPLDVRVDVAGSARAPQATFSISAAAGVLRGQAELNAERVARLRVSSAGLSLAEWARGLPAGRLAGTLAAEASLASLDDVPFSLHFSAGRYDALVLPEASAHARWSGTELSELALELHGYAGSLTLNGSANLHGDVQAELALSLPQLDQLPRWPSAPLPARGALELRSLLELQRGQLRARGTLGLRGVAFPAASLGALNAEFDVQGDALAPTVRTTLRATDLRAGRLRAGIARLQLDVQRRRDAFVLGLSARGQLQGEPFQLSVERARIGPDLALDVRGVQAQALGQRVLLSGRYGARGADGLLLQAQGIDLARLSAAFGLEPPLAGTAELRATARGPLQAPIVSLSLRGSELRVADAPPLALAVQAELDAGRGQARIEARAADDAGQEIALHAQAQFSAGGDASWAERLDSARFAADAAVERIDSQALNVWLARPLPLQGTGSLRLWLNGSLREPELQSELRAQLPELAAGRDVEVQLQASYARGAARAALIVADPEGPWLDAQLHLAHPAARTEALRSDALQLLERAEWDARVELYPRPLAALPAALRLPEAASSSVLAAQLSASHAPGSSPEAELRLELRHPERNGAGADCQGQEAEIDVSAQLAAGQLEGRLTLLERAHPIVELDAHSELDLGPLLASGGRPRVAGLTLDAALNEVELSSLPLVCNRVHGRISGSAHARGLLEASPELRLALRAQQLSLNQLNTLDATLEASVRSARARLNLELQHGATRSSLSANVPVSVQGGSFSVPRQQPLTAELSLDHLPLGALVPPSAAISRASGTVSGRVALSGTRDAPDVQGVLVPEGVGFTATALAQPLSDIGGSIVFRNGSLDIEGLSARDGDGTLRLSGHMALRAPATGADATLALVAKEFPLRQEGRVAGTLDASVRVSAALDADAARVAVQLDEASLWLRGGDLRQGIALEPHPDVMDPRAVESPARRTGRAPPNALALPLELSLTARDSIWVRREDFAVKLSARLTASRKQGQLRIRGPVSLRRGYLQLLGKVFELQDPSGLDFVGSDPPDPVLDIKAQAKNRGQGKTVLVKISGRARSPVLEFSIEDKVVSAGEAAQALFASGATSGSAKTQVQSFVSGLSSGMLALSARSELGEMMPMLLVEPGTETSASRVRAGFDLDSLVPSVLAGFIRGVYVEGIFASGSGQQQQDTGGGVLLELYLPNDLVTSGQYGPGETWSLDFGWEP